MQKIVYETHAAFAVGVEKRWFFHPGEPDLPDLEKNCDLKSGSDAARQDLNTWPRKDVEDLPDWWGHGRLISNPRICGYGRKRVL